MIRHFLPFALFSAVAIAPAQETEPAAGTPERVAHEQLLALRAGDWGKYTAHVHPKALAHFKAQLIPVVAALWKSQEAGAVKARKAVFADIPLERLEALPPEVFFERFMSNFAKLNPGLTEAYRSTTANYLGQVKEGAVVHVLARYTREIGGNKVSEVTVASFEQEGADWKSLLSSELEQLAARLRAQFLKTP